MDEAEWLACEEWRPMLMFLSGRLTQRKWKLYVCAGLRRLWDLLYDDASRQAVEVAEREADGVASAEEIREADYWAESPTFGHDFDPALVRTWIAQEDPRTQRIVRRLLEMGVFKEADLQSNEPLGDEQVRSRLYNAATIAYHNLGEWVEDKTLDEHFLDHFSAQEEWPGGWLVRELFGNPFRSVVLAPAWVTAEVAGLASAAYEERALPSGELSPARLAVLSDALEETGCTDRSILAHLRSPGPHLRGCWAVDLILSHCS